MEVELAVRSWGKRWKNRSFLGLKECKGREQEKITFDDMVHRQPRFIISSVTEFTGKNDKNRRYSPFYNIYKR